MTHKTEMTKAGWPRCTVPYTMYGTGFFVYGTVRYKVGVYGILCVYGIFQVIRKKYLKTIIFARWKKDYFFLFFIIY